MTKAPPDVANTMQMLGTDRSSATLGNLGQKEDSYEKENNK